MTPEKKFIKTPDGQPDLIETRAKIKSGKLKGHTVTVLYEADDVVREQFGGFVNFVREHAIVGLAVGFIIGQQAQGVIKQLIASFIDPTFKFLFGQTLSGLKFHIGHGSHAAVYSWGDMVQVLLNLLFVLVTIYVLIKIFNLDKLDKPAVATAAPAPASKK
jgi:large-conductance mechanosensitive channel